MTFNPYKLGTDRWFEKCLPFTLKQEGGFSNDRNDNGGRTMEGITQREYDAKHNRWGMPLSDVKMISDEERNTIYYGDYWLPHCPNLAPGLNLSFFDQCVNEGPREATILLQRSMGFQGKNIDGIWGDQTADGVDAANNSPRVLIVNYSNQRANFYREIVARRASQSGFLHDWLSRTATIETQALAMLSAAIAGV